MTTQLTLSSSTNFPPNRLLLLLALILLSTSVQALRFQSYTNERGETVFSNVPANCIDNGRLTCMQHQLSKSKPSRSTASVNPTKSKLSRATNKSRNPGVSSRTTETDLFDALEEVVEIKQLLDKYYPAATNPVTERSVKEQQQQIMNTLKLIRNVADQQELPSIERAIDIFRTHRID